jgi:hypothetical protein
LLVAGAMYMEAVLGKDRAIIFSKLEKIKSR